MRVLTPLCSAVLLAMACSSQAQAMSLTEAIQSTIATHPELAQRVDSRLSANEDVKVARGGFFPSVDLNAGYGRGYSDNTNTRALGNHHTNILTYTQSELRLRQMIFDGFNTANEVERTQGVVNSRAYYAQGTAQDLALRTIEVYLEVLKRRELVTLAKNNLQAHLRVNDQIGLRTQRGVGSTADSDQSNARRALAENNYDTAQVDLADAETNFYSVVGRMPDELETPPSTKGELPADLREAQQSMVDNNPYLKSAQADIQSAESQYEVAKSPFYPRFDAEAAVGANNNIGGEEGHDNNWRVGVVMNYNLFRGGSDKARLASNAHQINQAMDIRNNACASSTKTRAWPGTRCSTPVNRPPPPANTPKPLPACAPPTRISSVSASGPCSTCSTAKTSCTTPTVATPRCATPRSTRCTGYWRTWACCCTNNGSCYRPMRSRRPKSRTRLGCRN